MTASWDPTGSRYRGLWFSVGSQRRPVNPFAFLGFEGFGGREMTGTQHGASWGGLERHLSSRGSQAV